MQTYANARRAPSIHFEALPDKERGHCDAAIGCTNALTSYIDSFELTLALFEHGAENLQRALAMRPLEDRARKREIDFSTNWQLVAAKDCAMTTYHFCYALVGLHDNLEAAPTMQSLIDEDALNRAKDFFDETFPTYKYMRHGLAHGEEKHRSVSEKKIHTFKGDFVKEAMKEPAGVSLFSGHIGFTGDSFTPSAGFSQFSGQMSFGEPGGAFSGTALNGTTLSTSWRKKMIQLDISTQTLEKLRAVREKYYDAFFTLEESTRKIRNANRGILIHDSD